MFIKLPETIHDVLRGFLHAARNDLGEEWRHEAQKIIDLTDPEAEKRAAAEQEQAELAERQELARLQAKYDQVPEVQERDRLAELAAKYAPAPAAGQAPADPNVAERAPGVPNPPPAPAPPPVPPVPPAQPGAGFYQAPPNG